MSASIVRHPIWQKPQHHQDLPVKNHRVHWIELFYDLIHVVTIFLLEYALLGYCATIGYFMSLELIKKALKHRLAHEFTDFEIKAVGMLLIALVLFTTWREMPSWVSKAIYGIALTSQLLIPILRAHKTLDPEIKAMHEADRLK